MALAAVVMYAQFLSTIIIALRFFLYSKSRARACHCTSVSHRPRDRKQRERECNIAEQVNELVNKYKIESRVRDVSFFFIGANLLMAITVSMK